MSATLLSYACVCECASWGTPLKKVRWSRCFEGMDTSVVMVKFRCPISLTPGIDALSTIVRKPYTARDDATPKQTRHTTRISSSSHTVRGTSFCTQPTCRHDYGGHDTEQRHLPRRRGVVGSQQVADQSRTRDGDTQRDHELQRKHPQHKENNAIDTDTSRQCTPHAKQRSQSGHTSDETDAIGAGVAQSATVSHWQSVSREIHNTKNTINTHNADKHVPRRV